MPWAASRRLSAADTSDAPHISQTVKEGWFWNVHRGHVKELAPGEPPPGPAGVIVSLACAGGSPEACLFVIAAIAAFTTWTNDGFIPHARHGANGVRAFAAVGSKLEGTGFENEHIVHTHVALGDGVGAGERRPSGVVADGVWALGEADETRDSCFEGLGCNVILGEDFRKPAWTRVSRTGLHSVDES